MGYGKTIAWYSAWTEFEVSFYYRFHLVSTVSRFAILTWRCDQTKNPLNMWWLIIWFRVPVKFSCPPAVDFVIFRIYRQLSFHHTSTLPLRVSVTMPVDYLTRTLKKYKNYSKLLHFRLSRTTTNTWRRFTLASEDFIKFSRALVAPRVRRSRWMK